MIPALPRARRFDGSRARAIRESRGKSREEIAAAGRCSVSTIVAIELGYHEPSASKAAAVADMYGCSLDDLIVPVDEPEVVAQ